MSHTVIDVLCAVLLVSGAIAIFFKKIKLPIILAFILSGLLLKMPLPGLSWGIITDREEITALSKLGILLLIFSVGLEFGIKKIKSMGFIPLVIGLGQWICLTTTFYAVSRWLDFSVYSSYFISTALSFCSTTVILKTLEDERLKENRFVESLYGLLITEDIVAILTLVFLSSLSDPSLVSATAEGSTQFFSLLLILSGTIVLSWIAGSIFIPRIVRAAFHYGGEELLIIFSVGMCLGLSLAFEMLNLSGALGAFLMGMLLADTREIRRIQKMILPLKNIFIVLFFIGLGMQIEPSLFISYWDKILMTYFVFVILKFFFTFLFSLMVGKELKEAIQMGIIVTQLGEFALIIMELGQDKKLLSPAASTVIIGVTALSITSTSFFVRGSDLLYRWLQNKIPLRFLKGLYIYSDLTRLLSIKRIFPGHFLNISFLERIKSILTFVVDEVMKNYQGMTRLSTTANLERLAPWDEFLVELSVQQDCRAAGKSIEELALRERFGISIVAVERDTKLFVSPLPDFRMLPGDSLFVYGLEIDIKKASEFLKSPDDTLQTSLISSELKDMELRSLRIDESHPFLGKGLKELNLKKTWRLVLLGVMRGGEKIKNPPSNFQIAKDDELYVVGTTSSLQELTTSLLKY